MEKDWFFSSWTVGKNVQNLCRNSLKLKKKIGDPISVNTYDRTRPTLNRNWKKIHLDTIQGSVTPRKVCFSALNWRIPSQNPSKNGDLNWTRRWPTKSRHLRSKKRTYDAGLLLQFKALFLLGFWLGKRQFKAEKQTFLGVTEPWMVSKWILARARRAALSYINKKDEEINQLVKEVQAAQEVIKNANAALAASGQSTIPANTLPDSVRPTHSSHSTQTGRPRPPISTGRPPHPSGTGSSPHPTGTGRPRPPMTTGRPLMTTRPSKFMI